jgi:hypothetical protein
MRILVAVEGVSSNASTKNVPCLGNFGWVKNAVVCVSYARRQVYEKEFLDSPFLQPVFHQRGSPCR